MSCPLTCSRFTCCDPSIVSYDFGTPRRRPSQIGHAELLHDRQIVLIRILGDNSSLRIKADDVVSAVSTLLEDRETGTLDHPSVQEGP
jgi:hypothetical protein